MKPSCWRAFYLSLLAGAVQLGSAQLLSAQPAAKPPAVPFAAHRASLEALLKSGDKDKITEAFAGYKQWFIDDKRQAENAFWYARPLIMPLADHAQDTLDLIDLALEFKHASDPANIGYLYTLQAESYMLLDKPREAMQAFQLGLDGDGGAAGREALDTLPKVLIPAKKQKEMLEMFTLVIASCSDDPAVVEGSLKQQISLLNAQKQYPEALAAAKSLFNVCTLDHTADAITVLDRQFLIPNMDDRSKVDQFRQEQTQGAAAPAPGQPPKVSPLMQAIKVDPKPFDEALTHMPDLTSKDLIRHATLLLVADRPADALDIAKNILAQATDAKGIAAANELIGRCYKAQDGTIGRANAWIASNLRAH